MKLVSLNPIVNSVATINNCNYKFKTNLINSFRFRSALLVSLLLFLVVVVAVPVEFV